MPGAIAPALIRMGAVLAAMADHQVHSIGELWERLQPLPERAAGLNLDKADVLAGALADLKRVQIQQERMG